MIINDKRALAHIQKIEWVKPIEGADNIELIGVLGWMCIAKKGEFQVDDLCVYFEIDSKLPEEEWSEFLRAKHFKVKTMKLGKFCVVSQGLALPIDILGDEVPKEINTDVTDILKVIYSVKEDNKRKGAGGDGRSRQDRVISAHPNFFKHPIVRKLMRNKYCRKFLLSVMPAKKKSATAFPTQFPYISKTDEERVENAPWILEDKDFWVQTEKLDGTSSTYILERKRGMLKDTFEYYVCSRNVRQLTPSQKNYHKDIEGNIYWMMSEKYNIYDFLKLELYKYPNLDYIAIQGESIGPNIQGNPYRLVENRFYAFNLIDSVVGRWNSETAMQYVEENSLIKWAPIIDAEYTLPDTMEEMKESADGKSTLGNVAREGFVYRRANPQEGKMNSFKNVSRTFLLKHHQ